jgi:DnaJ-class molecular chaperone
MSKYTCTSCIGTGEDSDEDDCHICKGTGEMDEEGEAQYLKEESERIYGKD